MLLYPSRIQVHVMPLFCKALLEKVQDQGIDIHIYHDPSAGRIQGYYYKLPCDASREVLDRLDDLLEADGFLRVIPTHQEEEVQKLLQFIL